MKTKYPEESFPASLWTGEKLDCQNINDIARTQSEPTEEDFLVLSKEIRTLFELAPQENIYEFIAASLSEFLKNCIVLVNSYNEALDTLNVRAVAGLGSYADKIVCMLGNHPIDMSVSMNDDAKKGLITGRLTRVAGGIYELATHSIPRMMCKSVEEIIGIRVTYAMGITWSGKIMGSVAILVRDEIRNSAIIETFINYSAIALQRRLDR